MSAETLFVAHQDRLYRYLCRVVGRSELARELTQDVFVRVAQATVPSASESELRAWLFRIARNLAVDHYRRQQRGPDAGHPVDAGRPATQDIAAAVNEAVARLSAVDRDVFLLREVGGLSYTEIASACDLTPDAVRSRLHRTRLELREMLAAPIAQRRAGTLRWHQKDDEA